MMPDITDISPDAEEPPSFEVNLTINDTRWADAITHIESIIHHTLITLLEQESCEHGAMVAVVLSNDDEIQTLNRDFRHKDKPTNVLSFPDGEEGALGDIILSFDTLKREASEQNKTFQHHIIHMLTHGTLHLLGHDHEEDGEAAIMEAREISFLKTFNISNPYSEV